MTDRLRQLLDEESRRLEVPEAATDAVVRRGRALRRQRRALVSTAGLAAAAVVAGSVLVAGGGTDDAAPDPAGPGVPAEGGVAAFAYGRSVYLDEGGTRAEIDDKAVKSLFYTSAGVLVRHGNNPYSDGGGPQRFSLVSADGDVTPLGLVTEETVHASDPDQPYVAYGEAVDGTLEIVVYDVAADTEAARVEVAPTRDGWFPVSLDGTIVYVQNGYGNAVFAVDWRAGTASPSDLASAWDVVEGRVAMAVGGEPAVLDVETGEVLLTVDRPGYFELSPDGRYALLIDEDQEMLPADEIKLEVYDVASGSSTTVEGAAYQWGWTAAGDLFRVDDDEVLTCDTATGACASDPFTAPAGPDELRLGGRTYES